LQKKRTGFLLVLVLLVFLVSSLFCCGCDLNRDSAKFKSPQVPLDVKNASLWDKFFVIPLSFLLDWFKNLLGSYGYSILVVTFFVRLALLPFTLKQQKNFKVMQKYQPQIAKIREKYKSDPQKMQLETMKFFKENNINPMAGCLPLLIQFPILIAIYQAIVYNPHIYRSSFLYLELGKPDPYLILPIFAGVTTYLQSLVSGAADNPQGRTFLFVMPITIFLLAIQFPSALSLYWVYGNIITIFQYALFLRTDDA